MAYSRRSYKGAAVANALGGGGLAANGTSITLASAMSGWTTSGTPFFVVVDPGTSKEEKICVIYSSVDTLTVVDPAVTSGWTSSVNGRGFDDTTDKAHDVGATIYPVFTATEANQANELVSKYTVNGDIVVHGSSGLKTIPTGGSGNNNKVLVADSAVTDGGVKWAQINADGIATDAVTSDKILANAVGSSEIASGAVGIDELATAVMNRLVPVGTIAMYGGSSAPTGWLLCNGDAFNASTYPNLNTVLGVATTPDLKGRVPVGAGTGSGLTARSLGATGGNETHTLGIGEIPSHNHNGETSQNTTSHSHAQLVGLVNYETGPFQAVVTVPIGSASGTDGNYSTGTQSSNHIHTIPSNGGGGAHNNMQPFRVVNYIIKHD
jgi:microcystin-dependent protein